MIPSRMEIFGVSLNFYGLVIGLAIGVGAYICVLAIRKMKMWGEGDGLKEDWVWQGMWWALVGGVVGARLYHVVDEWGYYSQNLSQMVAVWNGGLGIYGAMMGGVLGLALFSKYKQIPLKMILDIAALGLPLGQAIGRWGNYINQELYGKPTTLPWGIYISPEKRLVGYETYDRFHPLFLYEALGMMVVFLILWWSFATKRVRVGGGGLAALYLIGYGLVRLMLDPMRLSTWRVGGLAMAQVLSVLAIAFGIWWWYKLRKQGNDDKK